MRINLQLTTQFFLQSGSTENMVADLQHKTYPSSWKVGKVIYRSLTTTRPSK